MTYTETIESLRCCFGFGTCSDCKAKNMTEEDPLPCKLNCKERLGLAAADLIERLTAENAKAAAERDALLEYAKLFTGCDTCKRRNYCKSDSECNACEQDVKGNCYCKDCERGSKWEWQGLAETSGKGDKA